MNIVVLNDLCGGGAAIACFRLVDALQSVPTENISVATGYNCRERKTDCIQWNHGIYRLSRLLPLFSRNPIRRIALNQSFHAVLREKKPDVINLHNLHDAPHWTLDLLQVALDHAPVVWTLHDMWPLTGGSVYDLPNLPGLPSQPKSPKADRSYNKQRQRMKEIVRRAGPRLSAVGPSQWMAENARKMFDPSAVHHVFNSVPLDVFHPEGREEARTRFGFKPNEKVGLVVAVDHSDPRKGSWMLLDALREFSASLTLAYVGRSPPTIRNSNVCTRSFGTIGNSEQLSELFRAADFLIHPAILDNLPNVMLESLACGTPVVAFRCGGIPDIVIPGRTGWLADRMKPSSLAEATVAAMTNTHCKLRASCREFALNNFAPTHQADLYLKLLKQSVFRTQS